MTINILVSLISLSILVIPLYQKSTRQNLNNDNFFEIKYENLLKQKNGIFLSQLATNVEYIKLETNEKCLIYDQAKYYFSDNFIFVKNRDHILKFSSDGKFIKQIGTPGRGPGEIVSIYNTSIIPEKKLIVLYVFTRKLMYFNFDGKLLKTAQLVPFSFVEALNNNNYIAISLTRSVDSEKYTHLLLNESGDTLSAVKNAESWKSPNPNQNLSLPDGSPPFEPFYTYKNKYYLKSVYNDTVYVINANRIMPSYFIDLGNYRLPVEKKYETSGQNNPKLFWKNLTGYFFSYVFEAGDRLFLTTNEWGGDFTRERFVINRKEFVANTNERYSGVYKGWIDNDWDGGTPFWPKGNINDNKVYMPIYAADLKNVINFRKTSNSLKTMVKYPDKRTELEKMASEIDISDNPLLMIVTLKND